MDQTQHTDAPPPPPPASGSAPNQAQDTADRISEALRALRRSRTDRIAAGVCGGVARSLRVDPLLVRISIAVLVFFAGAGLVLYALGWLLLPVDDGEPSVAQRAVWSGRPGDGRVSARTIVLAVALAVVAVSGLVSTFGHWDGGVLFALAVAGVVVLLLHDRGGRPEQLPGDPVAYGPQPAPAWWQQRGGGVRLGWNPGAPTAPVAPTGPVSLEKSAPVPGPVLGEPLLAPRGTTAPWPPAGRPVEPPRPPRPPRARRERSLLGRLTWSLLLILVGVLVAVDLAGGDVPGVAYVAAPLALVGLALVVGTFVGRSRGLIALGVVLAVACGAVVAGGRDDAWNHRDEVQQITPVSVAGLPQGVDLDPGRYRYDLSALQLPAGEATQMEVHVGVGELVVVVPPTVSVHLDGHVGVGDVSAFGQDVGGPGSDLDVTDEGTGGATAGTLDLSLDAGVGRVEVLRAQA